MPRYALRNKRKIRKAFSEKKTQNIINSLKRGFPEGIKDIYEGKPYSMISVEDLEHTSDIIIFYIIKKTYDVYQLAFKEFVS